MIIANVVEIIAILSIFEKPNFLATNEKEKKTPIKTSPTKHNHVLILSRLIRVQRQQQKYYIEVKNLFKINNNDVVLVTLLLI